jgi:cobalamin biosynthetic protein CobC
LAEQASQLERMMCDLARPEGDWLDLSSLCTPHPWEPPTPPSRVWHRPPGSDDGLSEAATGYYGAGAVRVLPNGSAAMAALARLRRRARVGVIEPGYSDWAPIWSQAGHDVVPLSAMQMGGGAGTAFDVLIVANPSDPDGTYYDPASLLEWRHGITSRSGWMIVDEGLVDATPEYSLAPQTPLPGSIVLRSLAPFFGLAGAPLAFALAPEALLDELDRALTGATVEAPARWVARHALSDRSWQARMRAWLPSQVERLDAVLARHFGQRIAGTPLFRTVRTPHAPAIQEALAQEAILVRLLERPEGLRFAVPAETEALQRLDEALAAAVASPGNV